MRTHRGRLVATAVVVVGFAVVVASSALFREGLTEQWYLWRLGSSNQEVSHSAAEKLAQAGSLRAIPRIFSIWESTQKESNKAFLPMSKVFVSHHERQGGNIGSGFRTGPHTVMYVEFDSNVLLVALSRILERRGEACVPYLVEELQSAEWFVSCLSLTLLGELGAEARSALLAIAAVATELTKADLLRELAVCALAHLETEETVPAFLEALRDNNAFLQNFSSTRLQEFGEVAVPGLIEALGNKRAEWHATNALGNIGPPAKAAIPLLIEALGNHENERVRRMSAYSLGRIGPATQDVIPALQAALRDTSKKVQKEAEEALALIQG